MKRLPLLFIVFSLVLGGCASRQSNRLHSVAITSILSTLIQDVRGDNVISQEENALTDNQDFLQRRLSLF